MTFYRKQSVIVEMEAQFFQGLIICQSQDDFEDYSFCFQIYDTQSNFISTSYNSLCASFANSNLLNKNFYIIIGISLEYNLYLSNLNQNRAVNFFLKINKVLLVLVLIVFTHAGMFEDRPNAIRCGPGNDGSIFIAHSTSSTGFSYYFQIWDKDYRSVAFKPDGSYHNGSGTYEIRSGCQNKSISDLQKEGRTYYSQNQSFKRRIAGLEATIEVLKKNSCSNSFSEYEKVKQVWKKECKSQLLAEIKTNGLQIGSRWAIQQESGSYLVSAILKVAKKRILELLSQQIPIWIQDE